ncbi:spore cortex biosynthesis protein YabQ [Amphibacillus marinus]|uniref:Spore cortex biosynthesis protein YabQ n=1 Tax=Amphibacillus marinus TaxID=872970 RepID=A0A1H8TLJ3_9BACI|nr:spore cortex biosynthesis protein YabQ [Amphibacillus marinus]SEO91930.1 spore cortex biosynthesis protein YabQ [Amphibacillus marinus]
MSVNTQLLSFAGMVLVGVYLGCMFDTNERLIKPLKGYKVLASIFQFAFWLAQSFISFLFLVELNGGQVHLYFLIAVTIGFWFYLRVIQHGFQWLLEGFIVLVKRICFFIYQLVYYLIIKPIIYLYRLILAICGFVFVVFSYVIKIILTPILWIMRLLWRCIPKNVRKYLVSLAGIYSKIENTIIKRNKKE